MRFSIIETNCLSFRIWDLPDVLDFGALFSNLILTYQLIVPIPVERSLNYDLLLLSGSRALVYVARTSEAPDD